ncbi:MAG: polysaccharide pyruvyl transferase [Lentisphaerae bacterium RIFOXYB12_FULL_65_16]|nr:MAG: polysaccharide pyruvyl transferase [Lentisphaerae bacterium RIFOXYA12_64_32]OGV86959.1 MAG: polysaccharide pyruvyl transferase [Lentisphaerae bacterium RIFOXYB12_FULL_65_16]
MSRRSFVQTVGAAATAEILKPVSSLAATAKRPPHILLRSSWQVVNIGDIAHTPGVLALLEKHIPDAEVVLWASGDLSPDVAAMEHRRFPNLRIVKGRINDNGKASGSELQEAVDWADFLLHGSGPSFVAAKDVAAFTQHTRKPFGIYGITYDGADAPIRELMSSARFVFFRDSVSLAKANTDGVASPIMEFGPDGAFAADLRNDAAATEFLNASGLEPGRFLCCIPRLRFTPYWTIRDVPLDPKRQARNEAMKEHDNAPLRDAITAVVRQTGLKVLVCPEDMTQMAVGREMIIDKLPDDVRKSVVWRETFWLTDEALSTYVRSAGLFGLEMHSPIMCIGNGIPAIVCRFKEQTSKGFMWRDIGLDDWLFDMDNPEQVARLTATVLELVQAPEDARIRVAKAQEVVHNRQRETMAVLRDCLGA